MAGTVQDVEGESADPDLLALLEIAIRREIAHAGHAEARAALDHMLQHVAICLVRSLDRYLQRIAQLGRAADMVDMAMGQPDLLDSDTGPLDRLEDLRHVAAGVDHHCLLARLVPEDGAV